MKNNRKEITKFLGDLLVSKRLGERGVYYASEVSLDYGTKDVRRIDYLQFSPENQMSVSGIESGFFTCYEVKSCKADFNSGFGQNFIGEKNYFVMSMALYKEVANKIPHDIGALVPVPSGRETLDEFENPTNLFEAGVEWNLKVIKQAHWRARKRSMVELLFCMIRSGN